MNSRTGAGTGSNFERAIVQWRPWGKACPSAPCLLVIPNQPLSSQLAAKSIRLQLWFLF